MSCGERKNAPSSRLSSFDSVCLVADRVGDAGCRDSAMHLVLTAHNTFKNLSTADRLHYYTYCNIVYNNEKSHDKSIMLADSMLVDLDAVPDFAGIATWKIVAYNMKANALFAKGMYNDAYNYYFVAQKLAIDNKDSCSLRTYTYSLAMTLYRQQRFQQASMRFMEAYIQSSSCAEDFNTFYFRQEQLDNIGLCYNALKKYDSAMLYYQKALDYIELKTGKYEFKSPIVYEAATAVVLGNMAEIYMNTGQYDSAKVLYEKSININLKKGYTNDDAIINQAKLADLYFKTGELELFKVTLDRIHVELDTIPVKRVEMEWHKLMWKYCEYVQDSIHAFRHLRLYTLKNEDYVNANKALMETDLDMRVKDLEKQFRINLLLKDKKQQLIYLAIVTMLAIMAIVIIMLILRNAQKSKKNITILTNLNDKINEQKEQLQNAVRNLREKEKDETRILKSVAHDVMNPIAAIVSLTDILLTDKEILNAEQLHVVNLIHEASNNSLHLSKSILEASEEYDEKSMIKEDTDINALVANTVELLNYRALSKKQQIVTKYPSDKIYAFVYKEKIRRVLSNLIVNAIKFSYESTIIEVELKLVDKTVQISVKDYGIGIPEKNIHHIFDVFTETRQTGTSGEVTHGLGLSISQQIARAHNGSIRVVSKEGKGSTFYLEFPATI